MFAQWSHFWRCYPALLYGMACLLGCFLALKTTPWIGVPCLVLFGALPWADRALQVRLGLALGVMGTSAFYVYSHYHLIELPLEGSFGEGELHIDSLSTSKTHFGAFWVYKGSLKTFGRQGRNLPVRITLPVKWGSHPPANRDYLVRGVLKQTPPGYSLKLNRQDPWIPIKGSYSFAEGRYHAKKWVGDLIHAHIPDRRSADFLAGIATGDFEDRLMQYEFGRFGLQHIMAISGFHFALLAGILSFGLRLFLSRRLASALLIALLSTYFVFLGAGPSILRAWITILITLGGYFLERRGSGLNSLGVALLLILLYDPLLCLSVGFQFSFVATAAILCLFQPFDAYLQVLFKKRQLSHTVQMHPVQQHGYLILTWFRQGLALTLAVNLVTLPVVLFYFHKFALMGLVYNLFFPFLVSGAMLLLLLGFLVPGLHALNSFYTSFMLDYTYNMPAQADILYRVDNFPAWGVVLILCGLWIGAMKVQRNAPDNFAFI